MIVSPDELRKQTVATLKQINEALKEPSGGDFATLLQAKAMCLNTLVLLNEPRKR
jgi:hypothetical protein